MHLTNSKVREDPTDERGKICVALPFVSFSLALSTLPIPPIPGFVLDAVAAVQ